MLRRTMGGTTRSRRSRPVNTGWERFSRSAYFCPGAPGQNFSAKVKAMDFLLKCGIDFIIIIVS